MKPIRGIAQRLKRSLRGHVLEAYHRMRLELELLNVERKNPILVYQMGKVGSRTVVRTLKQLRRPEPIIHVHTLNREQLSKAIAKERASHSSHLPAHLVASSILIRKLRDGFFPCRVITLTREPIARAISFAFEDWRKKAPGALLEDGEFNIRAMTEEVARMLSQRPGHGDPTAWFDRELKSVLGFDVFSKPYEREKGYTMHDRGEMSLLVLRLEDLDRSLPEALSALLNIDAEQVEAQAANVGDEKWYAKSLRRAKQDFVLSSDLARSVVGTLYFQHFYGDETQQIVDRWSGNTDDATS